jgi:flagellar biosynthesis/type III secretory pathway protein FliH
LSNDSVSIEARDELARGDLVLRTDLGTLDARLKPQLQRLADALSRAGRAG